MAATSFQNLGGTHGWVIFLVESWGGQTISCDRGGAIRKKFLRTFFLSKVGGDQSRIFATFSYLYQLLHVNCVKSWGGPIGWVTCNFQKLGGTRPVVPLGGCGHVDGTK